jgi:23S rRNA (uracil-5-)-methyltransferase RumA
MPGADYMSAGCRHFRECGGCSFQDIPYEIQIEQKKKTLAWVLGTEGALIIGSPRIYGFRNKMEFSFEHDGLGLHPRGRFDSVIDLKECPVFSDWAGDFLERARKFALDNDIPYYNRRAKKGVLRYLILRESKFTGEKMVILIADKNSFEAYKSGWAGMVEEYFGGCACVVLARRHESGDTALTDDYEILSSKKYLRMKAGNIELDVSPFSFFQPNSFQIENMYSLLGSKIQSPARILDLYTGIGSIPFYLAAEGRDITGVEFYDTCVRDSSLNLENINPPGNIRFVKAKVKTFLSTMCESYDYIILDPPRSGMSYRVWLHLKTLTQQTEVRKIFYICCNLKSLSQDLDFIKANTTWKVAAVTGLDLFVHTPHLETIVEIEP